MVEGPTARAYAVKICRSLCGESIYKVYLRSKRSKYPGDVLVGRNILETDTIGKNILIFIDGYVVRLHLMMYGSIHIYNLEEGLRKSFERVRLMLVTENHKLVVYNAPIVEIGDASDMINKLKRQLGPDPLRDDWDRSEAMKRLQSDPGRKIGEVLLDQSIIAGLGNILRNEVLFRAGIHPERRVYTLSNDELNRLLDVIESLSREFLKIKLSGGRLKPILYVYNMFNKLCRVCGRPIKFYIQEGVGRKTFVCEYCQR